MRGSDGLPAREEEVVGVAAAVVAAVGAVAWRAAPWGARRVRGVLAAFASLGRVRDPRRERRVALRQVCAQSDWAGCRACGELLLLPKRNAGLPQRLAPARLSEQQRALVAPLCDPSRTLVCRSTLASSGVSSSRGGRTSSGGRLGSLRELGGDRAGGAVGLGDVLLGADGWREPSGPASVPAP